MGSIVLPISLICSPGLHIRIAASRHLRVVAMSSRLRAETLPTGSKRWMSISKQRQAQRSREEPHKFH